MLYVFYLVTYSKKTPMAASVNTDKDKKLTIVCFPFVVLCLVTHVNNREDLKEATHMERLL